MELPVDLGQIVWLHDAIGGSLLEPIREQRTRGIGIDRPVNHDVTDMDAFGAKLARHALGERAQRMFTAGEGGIAVSAAKARRGAGEQDGATFARKHPFCGLAAHEECGERTHLPNFAINTRSGFGDAETHIAANIEDHDRERPDIPFDPVHQRGNGVLVARIGMNAGDRLALGLDRLDEWLEVAAPARGDDVIALTRESPSDGAAQKIASPHHQRHVRPACHTAPPAHPALAGLCDRPILMT